MQIPNRTLLVIGITGTVTTLVVCADPILDYFLETLGLPGWCQWVNGFFHILTGFFILTTTFAIWSE